MRFIIFLIVFLSIYGGLHLYGFLKLRQAMIWSPKVTVALGVFMAFMVIAPVLTRISERNGFELLARFLGYVGFIWMSLIFLLASTAFVLDLYRLLLHVGSLIFHTDFSIIALSPRHSAFIAILLSVIITGYGAFEAVRIRTERVTITTRKIPESIGRITITQISDIHLGLMVGEKRLERILDQVQSTNPDILVSTGDLVDGQTDGLSRLEKMFHKIDTKYGKFAVTGNHEFYAGLKRSEEFIRNAGFTLLRGEGLTVSGLINVAGVDDPAAKRYGLMRDVPEKSLLATLPHEKFTLLLKHRPLIDNEASGLFDLQLSGHTHNGQIFPFNLVTMLFYPLISGLHKLEKGGRLYVSRGTGTWGPPVRFMSPPEVTVIELVHE